MVGIDGFGCNVWVARPMFLLRLSPNVVARRRRSGVATELQNLSKLFLHLFSKVAVIYSAGGIMLRANVFKKHRL